MQYRAEIDGLRAMAVLPVILFHAGFEWFSGGFVGVDVFFVISGYLITTIIISEMVEGKFSLINFYERRARRILPALFFIMAACLPFAWLWLIPNDLKYFGQSLVAVSTFSSNILFWSESGYFDINTDLKPLLHTWSLAVEEQYYILFPLMLMMTWRMGIKWILTILVFTFFISLVLAHWGAFNKPGANFYLLPTRGWELLIGVFTAFYLKYNSNLKSHFANQILSLLGFCMIIYSIVAFDAGTPFPSLYALIPTIGTGLIILSAVPNTFVHSFLGLKPIVGIGLLSYSAYLWHQPLLAFARHRLLGDVSDLLLIVLCVASILMAWFSWRFIEAPFRNKRKINRRAIFIFSVVGMLGFIAAGSFIHFTNGLERFKVASYTEQEFRNYEMIKNSTGYDMYNHMFSDGCKMWEKDTRNLSQSLVQECKGKYGSPIIVLGDSHAMNIYNIFSKSDQYEFIIGISQGGCRPHENYKFCQYDSFVEFLNQNKDLKPTVIFHQTGTAFIKNEEGTYYPPLNEKFFFDFEKVKRVEDYLAKIADLNILVIWLGPFTEYGIDPSRFATKIFDVPQINFTSFNSIEYQIQLAIKENIKFKYIPFDNLYLQNTQVVFNNCLIWRDADHFSICGEDTIAKRSNWQVLNNFLPIQ